ncbi:MAG: hypothetical protein WCI04_03415 [archaeon]
MYELGKLNREKRRLADARAKIRRGRAANVVKARMKKVVREVRRRAQNVAETKFLEGSKLQAARTWVNKSVPIMVPVRSIAYKNANVSLMAVPVRKNPPRYRSAHKSNFQYSSKGQVRVRAQSVKQNVRISGSRLINKIISSHTLLQKNALVTREVLAELGFNVTRKMDLTPIILEHLKKKYPSLVNDFKHGNKIKKTRLLGPLKLEWKNIWRDFNRAQNKISYLEKKIAEVQGFVKYKSTVMNSALSKSEIDFHYYDKEEEFFANDPTVQEMLRKKTVLENKYGEGVINERNAYNLLPKELTLARASILKFSNRLKGFEEGLKAVRLDRDLKGAELRKLLRLPVLYIANKKSASN